jgi:hypothetical protein
MTNKSTPAYRALWELMDVARGSHRANNAWLFALTWLAASRLAMSGQLPGATSISDLISPSAWDIRQDGVLPPEAKDLVWGRGGESPHESAMRTHALGIVTRLIEEFGHHQWDVIDAPWQHSDAWRADVNRDIALAPELCELAFEALRARRESLVWIPFDPSGQLVIRAVRRGMRVIAAGPGRRTETHLRLLLAIEGNTRLGESAVLFDVPRAAVKRELMADFLLATPPIGMKLQTGAGWRQWEAEEPDGAGSGSLYQRHGPISQVQIDRSDAWAIAAFWPRVRERAVFLASPSVLFAKGQEQRLREHLLMDKRCLAAVALLPTRQLSVTSLASAMLLLDRAGDHRSIRLVDATEMTVDTKSSMRYSRTLDYERVSPLISRTAEDENVACDVSIEAVIRRDFNLMPARYLRAALADTVGPRRPLGDLVTVIRAPVVYKDPAGTVVQEAGFPELDRWREVTGPCAKTTSIQFRKLEPSMLRHGDLLLSIKGTLGKSALMGDVPTVEPFAFGTSRKDGGVVFPDISKAPVVPSQSCIALRVRDNAISPILLFLYLRSDDFKKQIESLRVGATIAHVTPATVLEEIQVPVLPVQHQQDYIRRWSELCELEASIEDAQQRTEEIRQALWGPDA